MPLIYSFQGAPSRPRIFVLGERRARALAGRPPRSEMLRTHRNRVFSAGDPDFSSRLSFSELFNAEQWEEVDFEDQNQEFLVPADAGYLDIEPMNGERIRGLGPTYHSALPIYKDNSIHLLKGDSISDFVVETLTTAVGCVNHFAMANVGDEQFFVSRAGVHALSATDKFGSMEQSLISNDIRDFWNERVNVEALSQSCFMVDNDAFDRLEILLPVYETGSDGRTPNRVLCLHYGVRPEHHPFGLWSLKKISGRSMATTRLEGATRSRILVGSTDGYLNLQDQAASVDFPSYGKRSITQVSSWNNDTGLSTNHALVNLTLNTVTPNTSPINVGLVATQRTGAALITVSAGPTIPRGSKITRAYLQATLNNAGNGGNTYVNWKIKGELTSTPATYSTYANLLTRALTQATIYFHDVPNASGLTTLTIDIAPIVQELVNLAGWTGTAADKIALQIFDDGSFPSHKTSVSNDNVYRGITAGLGTDFKIFIERWTGI